MALRSELACLHLCSGFGGFELGLRLAGIASRTVGHIERESHAASTLMARMADQTLDDAPIWDSIETFDGTPWRGKVDLITAGFPCQPFSQAGSKLGVDDNRWLWPSISKIVSDVGPEFIFLENVAGLVRHGLSYILSDLAELGFDAEWGILSASEIGAPQQRERFWLLAHSNSTRRVEIGWCEHGDKRDPLGCRCANVADSDSTRLEDGSGSVPESEVRRSEADDSGELADTKCGGRLQSDLNVNGVCVQEGDRGEAGISNILGPDRQWPPGRGDSEAWANWISQGGPEPSVRRVTDGPPSGLAESLHLGGNGLVPAVAASAFLALWERLVDH